MAQTLREEHVVRTLATVVRRLRDVSADLDVVAPSRLSVHTRAIEVGEATVWTAHHHHEHELLWAVDPSLTVETPTGTVTVPPSLGLWLPSGLDHEVRAPAGSTLRCSWIDPSECSIDWTTPTLIAVVPLLADVLDHLTDWKLPLTQRRHAERFALDLLRPVRAPSIVVPMPTSPELRQVAARVLDDPSASVTLLGVSRQACMSRRSFTRRFARETGLSFGQWQARVRVQVAMVRLDAGASIAAAGRAVGYRDPSAFITAFARVAGMTPGAYVASRSSTAAWVARPADMLA